MTSFADADLPALGCESAEATISSKTSGDSHERNLEPKTDLIVRRILPALEFILYFGNVCLLKGGAC